MTTRETHRWVIPKGWPWPTRNDFESAAGEALEEAGIAGSIEKFPFGSYVYTKRLETGVIESTVDVFLLWVEEVLDDWSEHADRTRAWFSPDDAANAVQEVQLQAMLRALNDLPIHRESASDDR